MEKMVSFNRLIPKARLLQILGTTAQGRNLKKQEHCVNELHWTQLSWSGRSTSYATAVGLTATTEVLRAEVGILKGRKEGTSCIYS